MENFKKLDREEMQKVLGGVEADCIPCTCTGKDGKTVSDCVGSVQECFDLC